MFTAYFDDSGTDLNSDIAIAACYVSGNRGWDEFVKAWDDARWEEGFDCFHMAEFAAPREHSHEPWDDDKKRHVYARLARIINENKRIGTAVAVPKEIWNSTPEHILQHYGRQHYTFAVRMCMNRIRDWRARSLITLPIRYIFDWEMQRSPKREEISKILDLLSKPQNQPVADLLGLEPDGYSFEHKEKFRPLQAADILAWQMRSHMRKVWPLGRDDPSLCHQGFRLLREDQEMDLGFFTKDQIESFVAAKVALEEHGEVFPVLYP
ncbi:MAG TPA: DUF3800 domain-containing protein [Terriglobales bacterium]